MRGAHRPAAVFVAEVEKSVLFADTLPVACFAFRCCVGVHLAPPRAEMSNITIS
jgi:hypothetical protein